jgi:hypothetical protein
LAQAYASIPGTLRHQVLPALRKGAYERQVWLARLGKRTKSLKKLVEDLEETFQKDGKHELFGGRWKRGECKVDGQTVPCVSTDVVDALLLLEERERLSRPPAQEVEA